MRKAYSGRWKGRFGAVLSGVAVIAFCLGSAARAQVLRYTFDEASSGTTPALDSGSGTPAPGTFTGGAIRTANTPGASAGALDLTANGGVGTWVSPGDINKIDSLTSMTVLMWVNLRGTPSNTTSLASDVSALPPPAGQGGWYFAIGGPPANCGIAMEIWDSTHGSGQSSVYPLNADHRWVMVAATFDGTTTAMTLYAGTRNSSMASQGGPSVVGPGLLPNTAPFIVGDMNATLPAWIDDVRIYDRALSLGELEAVRAATAPEPAGGLLIAGAFATLFAARRRGSKR